MGMSRFAELAQLKELESNASGDQWDSIGESVSTSDMVDIDGEGDRYIEIPYDERDAEFIAAFRNAAPWLLRVAEAFRPGDADEIDYAIDVVAQYDFDESTIATLRRLQKAAEELDHDA